MKEEARRLLEKGRRALRAADRLLAADDVEFAVGRAYYAMLYAAQALLREEDVGFRKHSGVHAAFGQRFAKTGLLDAKLHRWLLDAFDARLNGDYDAEFTLDPDSVKTVIEQARRFIETAALYLDRKG